MTPDIVEVERVPAGVLIVFEDGRSAIYSTVLLYQLLPTMEPITAEDSSDRKE
ncbi:MAG: hypothetical protein WA324_26120 [Bryobacteraceae bacterium]|jgi:hypothetical protein